MCNSYLDHVVGAIKADPVRMPMPWPPTNAQQLNYITSVRSGFSITERSSVHLPIVRVHGFEATSNGAAPSSVRPFASPPS